MQDMQINDYQELDGKAGEVYVGMCIAGSDKSDYTVRNLVKNTENTGSGLSMPHTHASSLISI